MKSFEHKKDVTSMFGLIGIIIIINILRYINGHGFSLPVLGLTLLLTIMVFWMWLVSSYSLENKVLIIRNGPFSQKIEIGEIIKIKKGVPSIFKGKMSNYQLILIYGKKKKLNVYPIDRDDFIKALLKINHQIKVE